MDDTNRKPKRMWKDVYIGGSLNGNSFFWAPPPTTASSTPEPKTIRCPSCGGPYLLSSEYITNLPNDNTNVEFPCKYKCKIRANLIHKRLREVG